MVPALKRGGALAARRNKPAARRAAKLSSRNGAKQSRRRAKCGAETLSASLDAYGRNAAPARAKGILSAETSGGRNPGGGRVRHGASQQNQKRGGGLVGQAGAVSSEGAATLAVVPASLPNIRGAPARSGLRVEPLGSPYSAGAGRSADRSRRSPASSRNGLCACSVRRIVADFKQ